MNKEKNLIVAGAAGAAVVIGGIMLLLKSRERKNIHVQALKDLKKELYPLLKEITAVSNEESTPSGDDNRKKPFNKLFLTLSSLQSPIPTKDRCHLGKSFEEA